MPKKNIIWLASYPKSGNTWVRIFLANYLNKNNKAVDINKIDSSIISSSRNIFDIHSGVLASDLSHDEVDILRPQFYEKISEEVNQTQFIKTHDAYTYNSKQKAIFPEAASKGVIHIVRNPLDVAISFAYHLGITPEASIERLNNKAFDLAGRHTHLQKQFRQKLLSWSMHYESWKACKLDYLLIRYEDLLKDPHKEFEKIIRFSQLKLNQKKLEIAIENSSFSKLKQQEISTNFKEKPLKSKHFFRKGISGNWTDELDIKIAQEFIQNHKKVIVELDYESLYQELSK